MEALTFAALALLTRYVSRYEGTKCACCKGQVAMGDTIVRLTPDFIRLFGALGLMNTKVFKYSHESCMPPELPGAMVETIKAVTLQLWGQTDPNWPKDFIGFNKADAGPASRWIKSGFHPFLAYGIAQRLTKYAGQLGEETTAKVAAVVAEGDKLLAARATAPVAPVAAPKPVTPTAPKPVKIDARGNVVVITLDPPWVNKRHAEIKDRVKAVGGRYDGATKTWSLGAARFIGLVAQLFCDEPIELTDDATRVLALAQ